MNRLILGFCTLLITIISACSESSGIYIDIEKQAIISCDGLGLKDVDIKSDCNDVKDVRLEGTASIIYFNKINPVSKTSVYGDAVYNYSLELKPNCSYTVKNDNGYDHGPFTIKFKTDKFGKIQESSDVKCNN